MIDRVVPRGDRLLQGSDHIGVEGVVFLPVHILQQAALLQRLARVPGHFCQTLLVSFQFREAGAFYARGHTAEGGIHHFTREPNGLEQLCAAVGADRGNAHLGHDLEQALVDALAVVLVAGARFAQQFTIADQILKHAVGEIGIDGRCAKPEQARHLMGVAGTRGFNHQVRITAQAAANQVVVHGAGRHQAVNRQALTRDRAVGDNQNGGALAHRLFRGIHEPGHRLLQIHLGGIVGAIDIAHFEAGSIHCQQRIELALGQDRRAQNHAVGVFRTLVEHVLFCAEIGFQRHHDGLAQRIDRGVRHLGKLLPEEVVQGPFMAREHGHGRIVAHGAHRFIA